MKQLFLLITSILLSLQMTGQYQAQSTTEGTNFPDYVDHVFENMDLSQVPTGMLAERALGLIPLDRFDGQTLSDSSELNFIFFNRIYYMMYAAAVGNNILPHPDTYYDAMGNDTIPLGILLFDYAHIRPDVIDAGILDTVDGQFVPVTGNTSSPYLQKKLCAVHPMTERLVGAQHEFVLASNKIFSNFSHPITSITMDWDDGNGLQSYQVGDNISIQYGTGGIKNVTTLITLSNGEVYSSNFGIIANVPEDLPIPENSDFYSPTPNNSLITVSGATVNTFLNCPDEGLTKPLILLDGFETDFDENSNTYKNIMSVLRFSVTPNTNLGVSPPIVRRLLDDFYDEGYDIIFVDWEDGRDLIQNNSAVFTNILNSINTMKADNGSTESNKIIGLSMGGVIAKYTLRNMEINNPTAANGGHDVDELITYDSPLRGANVPLGVQAMLDHLANFRLVPIAGDFITLDRFVPVLKEKLEILDSPASRQMTIFHIYDEDQTDHNAFYNELAAMGDLEHCTQHSISNGSMVGNSIFTGGSTIADGHASTANFLNIDFLNQEILFGINLGDIISTLLFKIFQTGVLIDVNIKGMPNPNAGNFRIYKGRVSFSLGLLGPIGLLLASNSEKREHFVEASTVLPIDGAPGGVISLGLGALPSSITKPYKRLTFVPSVSALDLASPSNENLLYDVSNSQQTIASGVTQVRSYSGSRGEAGFDTWYDEGDNGTLETEPGIDIQNQKHVAMSYRIAGFLLYRLTSSNVFSGISNNNLNNRTFNFGTSSDDFELDPDDFVEGTTKEIIDESLTIYNSGKLLVNASDRIAFTDEVKNPNNGLGAHFNLRIGSKTCEISSPIVIIRDGGRMEIGQQEAIINGANQDIENTANVIIEDNAQLIIRNEGYVGLDQGSKIIVQDGAILRVESGGRLRLERGAKIEVESGGQLIIDQGANIDLWYNDFWDGTQHVEGSSIKIKDGGELVINGAFNFDGSGFFEFDEGNITTFNAPFELSGNGTTERFIRLNEKAILEVSGPNLTEKIILNRGLVEYLAGSKILIGINGEAEIRQVTFDAQHVDNDNTGIVAVDAAKVDIFYSEFNNFETGIDAYSMNLSTDLFKLSHVYFNECLEGIVAESCKYLDLGGVHFSPYDNSSFAMWSYNVERIDFGGSAKEYDSGLGAILIYNDLDANNDILMETTHLKLSNADLLNNEIGIYVWDDSRADILVTNNSLIDGNAYGIKAVGGLSPAFVNLTVNRGSQISNNDIGVYIAKGHEYQRTLDSRIKSYGTIEMTCAKLLDNLTGVEGEDLWLNIDACLNSGQPTQNCNYAQTNPSHFKSTAPINKLFYICYVDRTPVPIDATGNYWELQTNTTLPDYLSIGTQVGASCGGNPFDYSNAATAPSTNCDNIIIVSIPPNSDKTDCFAGGSSTTCYYSDGTSSNLEMNVQYNDAYTDFFNEDYTNSSSKFEALASISNVAQDAYCTPCQHYVNIARSRTFYSPVPFDGALTQQIDNNNISQSKSAAATVDLDIPSLEVTIFPNPTSGELNIMTNSEQSLIRIIDLHGRVKVTMNDGLDYQINTQSWAAGIYIVEIMDKVTMEVMQQRVVVQP
jgi:hypothetical protein